MINKSLLKIFCVVILILGLSEINNVYAFESLVPGSVFREYTYKKDVSPFKGAFEYYDSVKVILNIDDLAEATHAEMAINFWGGHIGTSNQAFSINNSKKIEFPQPATSGNPYCYFRCNHGNPPAKIPLESLKKGENVFTFYCGKQICYGFNWPHYIVNSFTVRVYYKPDCKEYVKGKIVKVKEDEIVTTGIEFKTDVVDLTQVESVEYIGYYEDYDLDGDGHSAGWQYRINEGVWEGIIGKQQESPYKVKWENSWIPQQSNVVKVLAKINSKNGLSYLTPPVEFNQLRQSKTIVKMYNTTKVDEYFGVRDGLRRQCKIFIIDSLTNAISAQIIVSSWSAATEDEAVHLMGINRKKLAESPGKLHEWELLKIPVPLDYLKKGENVFFIYSETDGHMFEVNFPGPSIQIQFSKTENTIE